MNMEEFTAYKYAIIEKVTNSYRIMALISNDIDIDPSKVDLLDNQIFSYPFKPVGVISKTYLCLDTNVSDITSAQISEFEIAIWVFTEYSLQKLDSEFCRMGNRIDNLVVEIDKLLNGYNELSIGKFELLPTKTFTPADGYTGKLIMYRCYDFNQNEEQING